MTLNFVAGDRLICPHCSTEFPQAVEKYVGEDDGIEMSCPECGATITITRQDDDEFSACTSSDNEDVIDDVDIVDLIGENDIDEELGEAEA